MGRLIGGRGDPRDSDTPGKPVVIDAELLADFGHHLRNQLNAVVGASGLLLVSDDPGDIRELAAIVQVGAEQASRLVDDLLDAASLQNGKLELALHPLDVRASVETCLGFVAEAAGAKGLDLSFTAAADVPRVVIGDSRRIEQIILTLLHGGIERTFKGGVGVELSCEERGSMVALHFRIRDTG
ncbi:MAG TPA: HAMP domain-containing sensor histidine kinase, partial [Patescibacteria group bacterium]|nr:HAMP domain-containing sensor histidine kinase [Patescibacteria group bacterium]